MIFTQAHTHIYTYIHTQQSGTPLSLSLSLPFSLYLSALPVCVSLCVNHTLPYHMYFYTDNDEEVKTEKWKPAFAQKCACVGYYKYKCMCWKCHTTHTHTHTNERMASEPVSAGGAGGPPFLYNIIIINCAFRGKGGGGWMGLFPPSSLPHLLSYVLSPHHPHPPPPPRSIIHHMHTYGMKFFGGGPCKIAVFDAKTAKYRLHLCFIWWIVTPISFFLFLIHPQFCTI